MGSKGRYILRIFARGYAAQTYALRASTHNTRSLRYADSGLGYPDAGFDLAVPEPVVVPGMRMGATVPLGVQCAMEYVEGDGTDRGRPVSYYLRSHGDACRHTSLRLASAVDVMDAGYRGEIVAVVDNFGPGARLERGQRLFRICPPDIGKAVVVKVVPSVGLLDRAE